MSIGPLLTAEVARVFIGTGCTAHLIAIVVAGVGIVYMFASQTTEGSRCDPGVPVRTIAGAPTGLERMTRGMTWT